MIKYILVSLSLFVMSISVFGQDTLEKDLNKSFRQYDLVDLNKKVVLEKVKTEQPVEIQAYGRFFQFVLTPHDLRSRNYKAIESTETGDRELERAEVTTFKGKLNNDYGSEVRLTITEEGLEGLIYTGDNKKFFITDAEKFSRRAGKSDIVVYGEEDLIKTVDLSNDTHHLSPDVETKIETGFDVLQSYIFGSSETTPAYPTETGDATLALAMDLRVLEVATEADFQWVTTAGGADAANREILAILNLVDGIYQRDLGLKVTVSYQHAWSTPDPYSVTDMGAELQSFLNYWNANYPPAQYPRDVAHLFTGKFGFQGLAYIAVTCNPQYAYGITGRSGSLNHLITAHEIGHNLSADHVDNSGSCANSIMNPSISSGATSFCDVSKSQIQSYVTSPKGACLTGGGGPTPTPNAAINISGTVTYGATATFPKKPVPGVLLSVTGTRPTSAYTDSSGNYLLSNLTVGIYTVTPYKSGNINGITPFDATLVLRHVAAGGGVLTSNQQLAADTNNSGSITPFDATQILRFVAAGTQSANSGEVGNWKFIPNQRTYDPLTGSRFNENYEAILIGEVNDSWTPFG
jgi:hypothetical protein